MVVGLLPAVSYAGGAAPEGRIVLMQTDEPEEEGDDPRDRPDTPDENDSDRDAGKAATWDDLQTAFSTNGTVTLTGNVTGDAALTVPRGKKRHAGSERLHDQQGTVCEQPGG